MSRLLPRRILLTPLRTTRLSSTFQTRPSPPKLPADQQAEFERLQRAASVSSAFQPEEAPSAATTPATSQVRHTTTPEKTDDVNVGLFRGAPPEFEGDTNPKTGEVGGPKNEPLRWGGEGDWSYNGRVTDF
ncbi:FMP21-like mitochondrial proteome protein [Fusarium denticulatum]|uniref:Succinate dehydrogenase assembly factor 4, mitochondrial n=1 Tax=Fusarium denticulatum TaxID=48507 RepID=A0A8H5X4A2_9HYPO|nr:FMP21-like mitochondrial proteome protein [Fusarium denticulatum]